MNLINLYSGLIVAILLVTGVAVFLLRNDPPRLLRKKLPRVFYTLFYLGKPPWDTGVSPPELMAFIESHPPGRALDLGCGTGTNVITLSQHGWQVVGVDFVPKAIRAARRKARYAGIQAQFFVGDVSRLNQVQGPFDLALDIGCFHSLPPEAKAAYTQRLADLLAHGATYLLYGFVGEETNSNLINSTDLVRFRTCFDLVGRVDGSDRGQSASTWQVASTWFTWQLKTG